MGKNLISLGIGIIVATLFTWNNPLTEQDIIEKATQLGMVYEEELKEKLYKEFELKMRLEQETGKDPQREIVLNIPKGSSTSDISELLTENGFDGEKFLKYVEERGVTNKIKYGEFVIMSDSSIDEIISILTN